MDPAQAPLAPTPEQLAQLEHLREVVGVLLMVCKPFQILT